MMDATTIVIAVATASVPVLSLVGYAVRKAVWSGRIEERISAVEREIAASEQSRANLHKRINDVDSTIGLRLASIDRTLSELLGELRGAELIGAHHSHVHGHKRDEER